MITIDPLHPAQSTILETLGNKPYLSTQELLKILQKNEYTQISQPNLYRLIAQLIDHQVIVKTKGALSLNFMWVARMRAFSKVLEKQYLQSQHTQEVTDLVDGERREYFAESFRQLDPLWNHLLIVIKNLHPDLPFYCYNSSNCHAYSLPETEKRLCENCRDQGGLYYLLGNNHFLDQESLQLYQKHGAVTKIKSKPPFPKEGYFLWVCGDYLIEIILPEILKKHLTLIFDTIKTPKDFDTQLFDTFFDMKIRCKLTLRRHQKDALTLTKKFQKIFGTSLLI